MISSQPSSLLPTLFECIEERERLTVLHIGNALPETVEFFSHYRCKLHFIDLFDDLSRLVTTQDSTISLHQVFIDLMHLPADTRFDLCLFWDLFNFLDQDAVAAMLRTLRPHLHGNTLAHAFAVHNLKTAQSGNLFGIRAIDQVTLRPRPAPLVGYKPCTQGQLEKSLTCFRSKRSVLLPQSRLELLLSARL